MYVQLVDFIQQPRLTVTMTVLGGGVGWWVFKVEYTWFNKQFVHLSATEKE